MDARALIDSRPRLALVTATALLLLALVAVLLAFAAPADAAYTYSFKFGGPGAGDGQFNVPLGLAVAQDGRVYATDAGNARVQVFAADGTFQSKWGSPGTGPSLFALPWGITLGPDGSVYVADTGNSYVEQFDAAGAYLRTWGSAGTGAGQFNGLRGIAATGAGDVFTAEIGTPRVQKFSSTGAFAPRVGLVGLRERAVRNARCACAADALGNVYVLDIAPEPRAEVLQLRRLHHRLERRRPGSGSAGHPMGIAVDANGDVYVADTGNDRVQKFTSERVLGHQLRRATAPGTASSRSPGRSPSRRTTACTWATSTKNNVQVFTDPTAGKPVIASVTPTSGKRKSVVTITGTVFGQVRGAGYVKFGAKKATKYTSWSSTSIVCKVPKNAVYGKVKIRIVTPGGTSAPKRFTVTR